MIKQVIVESTFYAFRPVLIFFKFFLGPSEFRQNHGELD